MNVNTREVGLYAYAKRMIRIFLTVCGPKKTKNLSITKRSIRMRVVLCVPGFVFGMGGGGGVVYTRNMRHPNVLWGAGS